MGMNELDKRERGTIFFAVLFLLLALFMLFYVPNSWGKRYKDAKQSVAQKQQELKLKQLEKIEEEERVQRQEQMLQILQAREPRFNLFSFITRVVGETGLRERAVVQDARRPRDLSEKHPLVDLELTGVSLQELIDLLYAVRKSNNLVAIYKMEVSPVVREQGLQAEITFVSVNDV